MKLVIATRNPGKKEEIQNILSTLSLRISVLGLEEFPELGEIPEPGETFEENALHKARIVAQHTGLISLADDSGLECDALGGEPGVYSARYSGEQADDQSNNAKLLDRLGHIPFSQRRARFRCVIATCAPTGEYFLAKGAWEGYIATEPQGNRGFGYDPLFYDHELGLTAAQMEQETKNSRSHRSKALQDFADNLPDFLDRLKTGKN